MLKIIAEKKETKEKVIFFSLSKLTAKKKQQTRYECDFESVKENS